MKKSVAIKWVKALRSGKYKQGKGKLQEGDKYCCLGVLCKLAIPKVNVRCNNGVLGLNLSDQENVKGWSGIKSNEGFVLGTHLASLNDDSDSLTFDEIADIIQICWEEL